MNTQKKVFSRISEIKKPEQVELSVEKVELALVDDIEKIIDSSVKEKMRIARQLRKLVNDLLNLNPKFNQAAQMAKKAQNQAKELGADDLVKLFGNRADLADDYAKHIMSLGSKIESQVVNL